MRPRLGCAEIGDAHEPDGPDDQLHEAAPGWREMSRIALRLVRHELLQ